MLNADGFDDLAAMFERRGYAFITLERALEDPAYQSADTFVGNGGITWMHRWALTQKDAEDVLRRRARDVPAFRRGDSRSHEDDRSDALRCSPRR